MTKKEKIMIHFEALEILHEIRFNDDEILFDEVHHIRILQVHEELI
jgi:hypothetical protein